MVGKLWNLISNLHLPDPKIHFLSNMVRCFQSFLGPALSVMRLLLHFQYHRPSFLSVHSVLGHLELFILDMP